MEWGGLDLKSHISGCCSKNAYFSYQSGPLRLQSSSEPICLPSRDCTVLLKTISCRSLKPFLFNTEERLAPAGKGFRASTPRFPHHTGQFISPRNSGKWTTGPRGEESVGVAEHPLLAHRASEKSLGHQPVPAFSSS